MSHTTKADSWHTTCSLNHRKGIRNRIRCQKPFQCHPSKTLESSMNILQIPRRFVRSHWGGTESVVLETSRRLLELGHQTEILCPAIFSNCSVESIQGVHVERTPYFYPYWRLTKEAQQQLDMKAGNLFSFELMNRIKTYPNLDLIHLHTGKRLGGIVRYVAKKRRIPYVVSLHGGIHDVPTEEMQSWTEPTANAWEWGKLLGWWVGSRRVLKDAAAIICVGQRECELTQDRYPHKMVSYLPNGVDYQRFSNGDGKSFRAQYGIPQHAKMVLTVGRIDPQKNQLTAIKALPQLLREIPDTYLVLLGHVTSPDYCNKLLRAIQRLNLEDKVRLVQGVDAASQELVNAYHAADVFLLPSIHEPFGIVILEAWAAGTPVVATAVGGVVSLVNAGVNGLLATPDDQQTLVTLMQRVLKEHQLANQLATAAKKTVSETYDWKHITQKLAKIYQSVSKKR